MNATLRVLMTSAALLVSCGDTGRGFVQIQLEARGTEDATFLQDGWQVSLTRADIGFGPIALCATEFANTEFCEAAVLEFRGSATIDGLASESQAMGTLSGSTGTVRSSFFDYGVTWLLTEQQPRANEGTILGPAVLRVDQPTYTPAGHSAVFAGRAVCLDGAAVCCPGAATCPASFDFAANVDVVPSQAGDATVNGVLTDQTIDGSTTALTIVFDASGWWRAVNFARLAAAAETTGSVTLEATDPDYSALVIGMTANDIPTLEWSTQLP